MPELTLEGFDQSEEQEIEELLKQAPIEDDLLEDFGPKLTKIGPGEAELFVSATGASGAKLITEDRPIFIRYLEIKGLIGAVRVHLQDPTFLKQN